MTHHTPHFPALLLCGASLACLVCWPLWWLGTVLGLLVALTLVCLVVGVVRRWRR